MSLPPAIDEYLTRLPQIEKGWLSAGAGTSIGETPNQAICDCARALLVALAASGIDLSLGPFLIGPLPSGGIGMDFQQDGRKSSLYLHNDSTRLAELTVSNPAGWDEFEFPVEEALQMIRANCFERSVPPAPSPAMH